jgi:hypothetical protein
MAVILSLLLIWMLGPTLAHADTVYLKNGQSIWGKSAFEEGGYVVVVRPSGTLRFPKSQVRSVEPVRNTLPPHYSPPAMGGDASTPLSGGADVPSAALTGTRGGAPAPVPASATSVPIDGPSKPTALPPPPPPAAPR